MLFDWGFCLGDPGSGGRAACVLRCGAAGKELSGAEPDTANNRMGLRAMIAGLAALKEPCSVKVVTDSQYLQRAMTRYRERWIASGLAKFARLAGCES